MSSHPYLQLLSSHADACVNPNPGPPQEFAKQGAVRGAPLVDRSLPVAKADHYASKARWSQCAFRHLPARILTYRDGVSDGEFNHVIRVGSMGNRKGKCVEQLLELCAWCSRQAL